MVVEQALKAVSNVEYDEELYQRFVLWKDHSGHPASQIARMLNRSAAAVSQYLNRKFVGDLAAIEKDIVSLLRREEDLEFIRKGVRFCNTEPARLIFEALEYCDINQKMGIIIAPSGSGKTEVACEYVRINRMSILITAHIKCRTANNILRKLLSKVGGVGKRYSIAEFVDALIDRLKGSNRLLIVDDSHFMTWEAFELVRKFNDCAGIGVVYLGQETLYEQMKGGSREYLFDQIYSRIAIKRQNLPVLKDDTKAIALSLYPDFDKVCLDHLFERARSKGRFRTMKNIIDMALQISREHHEPVTLNTLQEAERYLMVE